MLKYNQYITEGVSTKFSKDLPLIAAVYRGSNNSLIKILKEGGAINQKNIDGRTALMSASLECYLIIVDTLIKYNADVNLQDNDGRTALMMASTPKIINKLLDAGSDVNIKTYIGENVAMEYLRYESNANKFISYLNTFLDKGLDLDTINNKGLNLYEMIKNVQELNVNTKKLYFSDIEEYMNKNFPKYKEEWEFKNNVSKYNL